jgi:transposase
VVTRPPEVFVRSLSHQEAVRLKRLSTRAEHQSTRIRAAILLASNVKTPVPQIARMRLTDESHVRKVIHEFNEEGFDSLRPDYRGGRPRRITPTERQRAVAVAGARPEGVPLTRWSLDRFSAWLTEQGIAISARHLGRLLAEAGLSFQRTRSWKASPDPDYQTKAASNCMAPRRSMGPVISRWDRSVSTDPRVRLGAAGSPRAIARDLQPATRDPLHLRRLGRPPRPALRPHAAPPR